MIDLKSVVSPEEALVILGSQNAKLVDRNLPRSQIRPLQLISETCVQPLEFFDSWGDLGISSLAWRREEPHAFFLTTGCDLLRLDIRSGDSEALEVTDLKDVHEITFIDDSLWMANTGRDEVLSVDPVSGRPVKRIPLAPLRVREGQTIAGLAENNPDTEAVDTFHCNQIFHGFDDCTYVLVHHTSGYQLIKRIAQAVVKCQGDGGVINLTTGEKHTLGLKAPHNVRLVGDQYWVLDSGHSTIRSYDSKWQPVETDQVGGWGRGADISEILRMFYVGISSPRRRYLGLVPGRKGESNRVQIRRLDKAGAIAEIRLSGIEQVNSVHVISRIQAGLLAALSSSRASSNVEP
jgi:hypothetical protein